MKKLFLIFVFVFLLFSCAPYNEDANYKINEGPIYLSNKSIETHRCELMCIGDRTFENNVVDFDNKILKGFPCSEYSKLYGTKQICSARAKLASNYDEVGILLECNSYDSI